MIVDGLRRCSDSAENQRARPGRQLLTFLIASNLAMYVWDTFELKSYELQVGFMSNVIYGKKRNLHLFDTAGSHRVLRRAAVDLPEPLDDAPHHLLPVPLLRRPRRHLELGLQAGHSGPLRAQETEETIVGIICQG